MKKAQLTNYHPFLLDVLSPPGKILCCGVISALLLGEWNWRLPFFLRHELQNRNYSVNYLPVSANRKLITDVKVLRLNVALSADIVMIKVRNIVKKNTYI